MNSYFDEFNTLLSSEDKEACVRWALSKINNQEIDLLSLYTEILTPAMKLLVPDEINIGVSIWNEHVKTLIVRTIVESCYLTVCDERTRRCGEVLEDKVLVITPPDEYHEMGPRMAADFFIIAGFNVQYIGANTPNDALKAALLEMQPKYVAIGISNYYHLFSLPKMIDMIRSLSKPDMKIIIGGNAVQSDPELYTKVGADMQLNTFEEICQLREGK